MKVAFIISTGRTGTKFLAGYLNDDPYSVAVHEPGPTLFRLGNQVARRETGFDEAVAAIMRSKRPKIKRYQDHKMYVEANNRLYSLVPALRSVFPEAKVVRVVRDGRDVVRSGMSRGWYGENDPFDRINARWFPGDSWYHKWDDLSRFQKVCWWWQKKDSILLDSMPNDEGAISVRFEDIFDAPSLYVGMRKIFVFLRLGLNINPSRMHQPVNATPKYTFPRWTHWTVEQLEQFDEIAGGHMRRCGYC